MGMFWENIDALTNLRCHTAEGWRDYCCHICSYSVNVTLLYVPYNHDGLLCGNKAFQDLLKHY